MIRFIVTRAILSLAIIMLIMGVASSDILMGTNLYGVCDYSPEIPFANVLKQARPFVSAGKYGGADGRTLTTDEDGYPVSLLTDQTAVSYLFTTSTHHPEGEYAFEYDGTGTVKFQGAGVLLDNGNVQISSGTVIIRITSTPVSNMRLWLPGHTAADTFNKQFLESVKPYHIVRLMNWTHTNATWGQTETIPGWGDVTDYTWADSRGGGVPISACLALCDTIKARPWFCIHHMADDEYIKRFVDALPTGSNAVIEYTNEVWNGQYRQSGYCGDMGVAAGLDTKAWPAKLYWQADRTRRIKELSGGKGTVVLASQAANAWVAKTLMGRFKADALAIAPYFNCDDPTIERLRTVAIPQALGWVDANKAVADSFGVPLMFYECGQHVIGATVIQNTPDMESLYTEYFAGIDARIPGSVVCHFTNVSPYGQYGDWGTTDNLYALDTAKRRAIMAFCPPKVVTQGDWLAIAGKFLKAGNLNAAGDALVNAGSAN